jgi:universal stress protein A
MKLQRILCPIDFSDCSQAVNEYASVLAQATGAELIYLHICQPQIPYDSFAFVNVNATGEEDREQLLEFKPTVSGVDAHHIVEFGAPADRIVEYARESDADLIVMGTHGRTGVSRALMGSIAEAVVRRATCPVLALKNNSKVPQPT